MAANPLPDYDLLHQLFRYEPETGKIFHRLRPPHLFKEGGSVSQEGYAKRWNAKWADKDAGQITNDGYVMVFALGGRYLVHRLAFKMIYNREPVACDHINGDRTDNRIGNLREVTNAQNCRNAAVQKRNKVGCPGVLKSKNGQRWYARVTCHGKAHFLGSFDTLDQAIAARKDAQTKLGFHPNHGRPA